MPEPGEERLEEIIRRESRGGARFIQFPENIPIGPGTQIGLTQTPPGIPGSGEGQAVPPSPPEQGRGPGLPGVIEEIIVTAPRTSRAATGLAGIVAMAGGFIASKFLEEISQQRLEESFAALMAPDAFRPGDTPVIVTEPVTPEIVVTAKRVPLRQRFALPPMPQFFPRELDPDPFTMQPITPREFPRPEVDVDVAVPQPEVPTREPLTVPLRPPGLVPMPLPTRTTSPRPAPLPRPVADPLPGVQPTPGTQPVPFPGVRPLPDSPVSPLTGLDTGLLPSPLGLPQPMPEPRGDCPPCPRCEDKEEQEEMRDECWKKLVKEGLFPSLDESFDWVEIDCLTGREL